MIQNYIGIDARIEAIVRSLMKNLDVDLSDYYTKEEVDALIASGGTGLQINYNDLLNRPIINGLLQSNMDLNNHMLLYNGQKLYCPAVIENIITFDSDVSIPNIYNKTEVDGELTSLSSYIDGQLLLKANTADVYNKSEVYTKTECDEKFSGGAQIAINNTTECSRALTGTNDWTKLTFMFNSNNRTELEIGFRLGGYEEYCKGKAWFSDFKMEKGSIDKDKNWHMACFIIKELNVKAYGKNINLSISDRDENIIESNMSRLQDSIKEISGNKMSITYDIINIEKPLKTISYDAENEYYVAPDDVQKLIDSYVDKEEYDYIYVAVRLGDLNKSKDVLVHDWIGLRSNGVQPNWILQHKAPR